MPNLLGALDRLERRRAKVRDNLMPDTCRIAPFVRQPDGAGGWEEGIGIYLEYEGSSDIPCRLDPTRHYRGGDVFGEELVVNEYTLWVPYGVEVAPDMWIEKGGTRFEVRKLLHEKSNSVAQMLLIASLE